MRVKTAEMTAESLRETGVAWIGLLRKLYEKSEVRVFEYLPICPFSSVGIEYLATNQRVGSSSLSTDTTRITDKSPRQTDFRYEAICGDSSIG